MALLRKLLIRNFHSQFQGLSTCLTGASLAAARAPLDSRQAPSETKKDLYESSSQSKAASAPSATQIATNGAQKQLDSWQGTNSQKQNVRPTFNTNVEALTQEIRQACSGCLPALDSKYVPPFSKSLLESLLAALPAVLRQKAKKQAKKKQGGSYSNRGLFEEVVRLISEYNRNLLYQLPGKSLGEVQMQLSEQGRLVFVGESKIPGAGRGVFAKVPIEEGSLITQYIDPSQLFSAPRKERRKVEEQLGLSATTSIAQAYVQLQVLQDLGANYGKAKFGYFGDETGWPIFAIPPLINDHSSLEKWDWNAYTNPAPKVADYLGGIAVSNNVAVVSRWGERFAFATRDIEKGEELFWTYGLSWWLRAERDKLLMMVLFFADEMKGSPVNEERVRALIQETWMQVRCLEALAQAGREMELELVGRYGPKRRTDVQTLKPQPSEDEDIDFLRTEGVQRYAKRLTQWKGMLTKESLQILYSKIVQ